MKKHKLLTILSAICLVVLCATTLSACGVKPKTFTTVDGGLSITVTSEFQEKSIAGQTMYLESKNSIVTVLKEEFSLYTQRGYNPVTMTELEYAQLVKQANYLTSDPYEDKENGLVVLEFEKTVTGRDFYYLAVCKKGADAFWLIQFGCLASNKESYKPTFINWAKSITLN